MTNCIFDLSHFISDHILAALYFPSARDRALCRPASDLRAAAQGGRRRRRETLDGAHSAGARGAQREDGDSARGELEATQVRVGGEAKL